VALGDTRRCRDKLVTSSLRLYAFRAEAFADGEAVLADMVKENPPVGLNRWQQMAYDPPCKGFVPPPPSDFAMRTARPIFNVKALETGAGYIIEAIWPDGWIERLVGLYTSPAAAKWVDERGDAWR
jgi:hypothetical protein